MQRQQTISEFLSSQSVIRVYFDSMPYGSGNQASSYQMMYRLRELGFEGKYEVIYIGEGVNTYYPDGNPNKNIFINEEKIINLFIYLQIYQILIMIKKIILSLLRAVFITTRKKLIMSSV